MGVLPATLHAKAPRAEAEGSSNAVASPVHAACHRGTRGCLGWLSDTRHGSVSIPMGTGSKANTAACGVAVGNQDTPTHQEKNDRKSLLPPVQKTIFMYKNFLFQLHFYIVEASQTA